MKLKFGVIKYVTLCMAPKLGGIYLQKMFKKTNLVTFGTLVAGKPNDFLFSVCVCETLIEI